MAIEHVYISYPDFRMFDVIDSEQFDVNNSEFQEKINELVDLLNTMYVPKEDATSGSEIISMKPIEPITEGESVQEFLENLLARLQSKELNNSGAHLIGTPPVGDIGGTTIHAQMLSIDAIIRNLNALVRQNTIATHSLDTAFKNHNHNTLYYTKTEMDAYLSQRDTTVHADVFTITSVNATNKTFVYTDSVGRTHNSTIDENGNMLFTLSNMYEPNANLLTVIIDDTLNLSAVSGGLIEVNNNQFKLTAMLEAGQEITCRYSRRTRLATEYSVSYGPMQPSPTGGPDMWFKVMG